MNPSTRRPVRLAAAALAAALALTSCSYGGVEPSVTQTVAQDQVDAALSTPTELTYWTWVPNIDRQVALFEERYPAIDVTVENVGQGGPTYSRLRTALLAGTGLPDVVQLEYQQIPSFVLAGALQDLTPLGAEELESSYTGWIWNQVSSDGAVYALPQDAGPMGNIYRADILEEAGVTEPPATYEEYAQAARQVKDTTGAYISNLPANEPAQIIGLLWQAGVKPFGYDGGTTVSIDVNSDGAKEVMGYWQDLIQQDLVSVDAGFNDQWYQSLASGRYAGWLTAAWGPTFLQGTAGDTSGLWRAAPLPQWDEGQEVSGNWGGSSNAVVAGSDSTIAAYELAKFINSDPASTSLLASDQLLFPASTEVLESPEFLGTESEFYGGQRVNEEFSEISGTVDTEFQWLPFMDYALQSLTETVGVQMTSRGDIVGALDTWQADLVAYAEEQGFTVIEGSPAP